MDRVRINFKRERGFTGALCRARFFAGGKPSPSVKNGGSGSVSILRERVIFLQQDGSIVNNAIILNSGENELALDIRAVGSFNKGYRYVFRPVGSALPYPSVSFERLFDGLNGRNTLNEQQRKLALLAFAAEAFDTEEILRSEFAEEIVPALKSLGATLYAGTLERVIASQFGGFSLPITGGEGDKGMAERFRNAETMLLEANENDRLSEDLARAAANHIAAHYGELFTAEDLYYFNGEDDSPAFGGMPASRKTPREKTKLGRKQKLNLARAILIFIAVECALFALWRAAAYYPARAALPENSRAVTLSSPAFKLIRTGSGRRRINITSNGETYVIFWGEPLKGSAADFIKEIESEPLLSLVVNDNNSVCAVSGAEREYLSVDDYNSYQKTQSVIGTILLAIFALIAVVFFIVAVLVIVNDVF